MTGEQPLVAQYAEPQPEFLLLVDPAWTATAEEPEPPLEAVQGAWTFTATHHGRFRPSPFYRPSSSDVPLDPVDALMREIAAGQAADDLTKLLGEVVLSVALGEDGTAVVGSAPDGTAVVLVATAYGHRDRVNADDWLEVDVRELAAALPERGVEVLLNPGAAASMVVPADVIREIAGS
ncbi:type VII secretion system-associated protein [Lentzea sp. NPDC059081]|uniref:type VII secretion system-associated protein n=1 Tax=Lentzea sp. NPDC059081 TaxID=3346719 RepID=UPI003691A3CA